MAEYDLAQRERIREALLAYVKEHKIGIPTLGKRITETVHRNPTIPVKTLQRFMKGEVRTVDPYVGFLAQFAEKISNVDPTPRLGVALSAFYSSKDKTDWSGTFIALESEVSDSLDAHQSKVEIAMDQGTWRVKEVDTSAGSHQIYDGAMTTSGSTVVIVLKDRLAGLPRMITVCGQGNGKYDGVATAAYVPRRDGRVLPQFTVKTRSARIALRR